MTAPPQLFTGYFPLWGASFDSEEVGLIGSRVMAYVPNEDEWRQVSKTDVWIEHLRIGVTAPPLCVVVAEPVEENEDAEAAMVRLESQMTGDAETGILALRLLQAGWFLDPALAEQTFTLGPINQRRVGPYRQAFLNGVPSGSPRGYSLSIQSLITKPGQTAPANRMWQLIRQYRDAQPNSSAAIAIDNFQRSYAYQMPGAPRVAFLFTAIETMLGGMAAPRFGEVEINSAFPDRLAAALRAHPLLEGTMQSREDAGWMSSSGREIRNAIAHGNVAAVQQEATENYERIQAIVRLILQQYIEFSVKWATDSTGIAARLGISKESSTAGAYNRVLDVQVYGNTKTSDLLRLDISLPEG
jgi:hypothetical protein